MRRTIVYAVAAALLTVALVLTLVGWGDDAAKLPDWQAFVLGLVQGFTELLPISSSGHLIIVPWLGDWTYLKEHESFNKTFDVALHLGTLVAVVAYFWHDLIGYLVAWCRSVWHRSIRTEDEKIAWVIVVASIPAAIVGAGLESFIEDRLGEPWQIAILLAVFALLLYWADRSRSGAIGDVSLRQGLLVGVRADTRARAGRLPLGDHDHGRPLPRAHSRRGRTALVPPARADRARGGAAEGLHGRHRRRPADGLGGAVRRRHHRLGRRRAPRDRLAARLRARHNYTVFVVYRLALAVLLALLIIVRRRATRRSDARLRRRHRAVRPREGGGEAGPRAARRAGPRRLRLVPGARPARRAEGYRVCAPDHRANGRSDGGDPGRWTVPQMADDVEALIGALGLEGVSFRLVVRVVRGSEPHGQARSAAATC